MATWNLMSLFLRLRRLFSRNFGNQSSLLVAKPPSKTDALIDSCYPRAAGDGCWITSCIDSAYNCIAWAAGESNIPWWPVIAAGVYWPDGVPPDCTVSAFVLAFGTVGYREWSKENGNLEDGYEKIAIYADGNGEPTHAARQLPNGMWVSKIGREWKDVEHATVEAIEGIDYGKVVKYLRRKRRPLPTTPPSLCQIGSTKICRAINAPCPP
jgi:hypothetical protein